MLEKLKTDILNVNFINLTKFLLIIGTIWYLVIYILPNFYSENTELEKEIAFMKGQIEILKELDRAKADDMKKEEDNRKKTKEKSKKIIKDYYTKTEDEKVDLFNKRLENFRNDKKK